MYINNSKGIDSQNCPMELRRQVWDKLADEWNVFSQDELIYETDLDGLGNYIDLMLTKKSRGRVVVKMD
ncbi:hypothetical protein E9993_04655 [Labilibacter sediminis]|nr:hypothetical protein E9993_04655 [Labilibacter sediminis]